MILVDQWNMLNSCEDPYEKKKTKKKKPPQNLIMFYTQGYI